MKAQARKSGQTQIENRQCGQKNLIALVEFIKLYVPLYKLIQSQI